MLRLNTPAAVMLVGGFVLKHPCRPRVSDVRVYHAGSAAAATVTGQYAPSAEDNDHDVNGCDVLIRIGPGGIVHARCEDDTSTSIRRTMPLPIPAWAM